MCPATDNPASCEIRAVAEIHRELCAVYGQNIISEVWYRIFKDG
jgi:hypothetical protein